VFLEATTARDVERRVARHQFCRHADQQRKPILKFITSQAGLSTLEYAVLFVLIVVGALALWSKLGAALQKQVSSGEQSFSSVLGRAQSGDVNESAPGSTDVGLSTPPSLSLHKENKNPVLQPSTDGGTTDMMKSCQGGSATACTNLERTNAAQLDAALKFIARVAPDLVDPNDPPTIEWDGTLEFWRENHGATSFTTGTVTLSRGYNRYPDLINTVAHELQHSKDGLSGRAQTVLQDTLAQGVGERHQQIYDRADRISDQYFKENP